MTRRNLFCLAVFLTAFDSLAQAQSASVFSGGLNSPTKIAMSSDGSLLVTESTVTLNTGRISIISRSGGARRSLIEGLPSGPAFPNGAALGPAGIVVDGRTLYIGITEGNLLVAGATPTSHPVPNPNGPGSPLFSSILKVTLSAEIANIMSGFNLTRENQDTLADGKQVMLSNNEGQTAAVEVLTDFPDYSLDPIEVFGHTTPYALALDNAKRFLYVADAGGNRIIKLDTSTGRWQTLVRFPRISLPAGSGPAQTDTVPTTVRMYGDDLLVGFLTGEPFAEGVAAVRLVNTTSGEVQPFINGLRSVTDVYYRDASPRSQFYVVEFRSFLIGPPMTGRVIQYDTPQGKIIASELIGPTGMVQDAATGEIFVVEFGANRVSLVKPQ